MIKRFFTTMLVLSFLNFAVIPNVAHAATTEEEEQEEADAKQARLVNGLLGLALLTYIITNINKKDNYAETRYSSTSGENTKHIKVSLGFDNFGYYPSANDGLNMRSEGEWRSPMLMLKVSYHF